MNDSVVGAAAESFTSANVTELENHLKTKLNGRVRNLRVILHHSGIVLQGLAQTYHAKQMAQHAVMMETRVPIHANEIVVC